MICIARDAQEVRVERKNSASRMRNMSEQQLFGTASHHIKGFEPGTENDGRVQREDRTF